MTSLTSSAMPLTDIKEMTSPTEDTPADTKASSVVELPATSDLPAPSTQQGDPDATSTKLSKSHAILLGATMSLTYFMMVSYSVLLQSLHLD